jgi:hypothetical protein
LSDDSVQGVQQRRCGGPQLGAMLDRQVAQDALAGLGERDEHATSIERILGAANQVTRGGTIDELDRGVRLDLEPVGDGTDDGRVVGVRQSGQREQELVLLRLEAGGVGGLFAEVEKTAELKAELREGTQVGRHEWVGLDAHRLKVYRDTIYFVQPTLQPSASYSFILRTATSNRPGVLGH